jgi:hypothetical protein
MKNTIYLLMGEDACQEYMQNGCNVDLLIEASENNELEYVTYKWDYNNCDVLNLLSTFQGMDDYLVISEEEFNILNK